MHDMVFVEFVYDAIFFVLSKAHCFLIGFTRG